MGKRGNSEGSIYYRTKRQRWCATISLDGGKRRSVFGATRKEVADKLAVALREQRQGLSQLSNQLTLEKYLDGWLKDTIAPGRRACTHLLHSSAIRLHINPIIGKTPLAKLTPQHPETSDGTARERSRRQAHPPHPRLPVGGADSGSQMESAHT